MPAIRRLSRYDLHCLAVETRARPIHMGILAVVDGGPLLDPAGELRLAAVRSEIGGRLADVPQLRRVVFRPGPLAGRPLWVDDPAFRVDHHVGEVRLSAPGDQAALLALTEQLMARPLDRSRPLWRMWFVTGLEAGRVGILVLLHHALADGVGAMRMVRALLEPPMLPDILPPRDAPVAPPAWRALVRDNLRADMATLRWLGRPATWQRVAEVARSAWHVNAVARRVPRTSLNAPVGPRRRLATLDLDLACARRVARAHGCSVNDVVLSVVAGGVRALLLGRGEPIERLRPRAGVAVALFSHEHGRAGNDIGTLHVPLPLADPVPGARLRSIAAATARAKRSPMVAAEPILRASLGRFGAFRRSLDHQRLINLAETYLPGPPARIDVLGAPVLELLPIAPLAGNLGLSFVALSYAGRLGLTVRVDADQFPDLDVLMAAMQRDCRLLAPDPPG
ncbi:MAG: wax ester/triacylglycerol synthase domain-containing protein [Candidatus Limnocylindrales bacterium]